jgi:O-antigen/teichoic acid export membrane protein
VSVLILARALSQRGQNLAWFRWARIRESLEAARLLLSHAWLSGTIKGAQTRLDVPLLGALTSPSIVGNYRVALDLAGVISRIGNPIQQAILPVMVELEREGNLPRLRKLAAQTTLGLAAPIVPAAVVGIALATPALRLLVGEEYAAAGPALAILVAAIGLSTLLVWARPLLVTRFRVAAGNLIAAVGVAIQVAVMLLFARDHGAVAAGAATAAMLTFTSLATALAALW